MNQSLKDRLHAQWLESDARVERLIHRYGWGKKRLSKKQSRRLQKHTRFCDKLNAKGLRVWQRGQR